MEKTVQYMKLENNEGIWASVLGMVVILSVCINSCLDG